MDKKAIIKYYSSDINGSEYITIFEDKIVYEKNNIKINSGSNEDANVVCRIEIKDKFFVNSMILGNFYMSKKAEFIELYNNVDKLNPIDIHRPKNTSKKELLINDNDLNIRFDMYIKEYGNILDEFVELIKKIILTQIYK